MIVSERKTEAATVRIHDEFCVSPTSVRISQLDRIVSSSYKRRAMEMGPLPPATAAR